MRHAENRDDPVSVCEKQWSHFEKETWANSMQLWKLLYSANIKEGESVQNHFKILPEFLDSLAALDALVLKEVQVLHLLTSLPDSYRMVVTALEASLETIQEWMW